MNKAIREEWKQYLFDEGRDYTLEEAIEKLVCAVMCLKNMRVRVTENLFLNGEQFEKDFHLTELDKATYIQLFNSEGYAINDCKTIVKVMDVIYHMFDVTKNEAFKMTEYAASNHLTITQTVKDKLGVEFDAIGEFVDTVLPQIVKYFNDRTVKHGKELVEIINEVLSSLK